MANTTAKEYRDSIIESVAVLDEADGSRIGLSEAIDSAREILANTYGVGFEDDLETFLANDENGDDETEGEDD